jgi:hypothetical protein
MLVTIGVRRLIVEGKLMAGLSDDLEIITNLGDIVAFVFATPDLYGREKLAALFERFQHAGSPPLPDFRLHPQWDLLRRQWYRWVVFFGIFFLLGAPFTVMVFVFGPIPIDLDGHHYFTITRSWALLLPLAAVFAMLVIMAVWVGFVWLFMSIPKFVAWALESISARIRLDDGGMLAYGAIIYIGMRLISIIAIAGPWLVAHFWKLVALVR